MGEPPDLAALARRYVELWQDQLTAMAADPAFSQGMAALLAGLSPLWPQPGQWPATPEGAQRAANEFARTFQSAAAAAGSASAGAASRQRQPDLAVLAGRLAALEDRLAALESKPRNRGKRARAKPQGPRRRRR